MNPEKYGTTRKLASCLLLASLVITILTLNSSGVWAQTPVPSSPNASNPSNPADPSSVSWDLEYDLNTPPAEFANLGEQQAQTQIESMLSSKDLKSRGVDARVDPSGGKKFKVHLNGKDGLDNLRDLIFTRLAPELDLLNGPIALDLTAPLKKGQSLPVILESRPATGFTWELSSNDSGLVSQTDTPSVKTSIEEPSAPAKVSLSLQSRTDGTATIRLVYHRPWDANQPVTRRLSLVLSSFPAELDLSNPVQDVGSPAPVFDLPMVAEPLVALPTHFDWRSLGKVPPVRDQKSCGSCWAFGTVGAMESAMMVQAGASADLSEQYLISCNKEGWGCDGGWWAHDYHQSALGTNQTTAGAVLESAKPYTATKGTCTINYNHPYKLASWGYVAGRYDTIPTPDQIKNAIYTYGSVAATVCSGTAWGNYTGGVFSTEERNQCGGAGQVNHAIVLVGWDDPGQYWILRNSWGSSWGENGYMRIKWGTSNVGYGASYVLYGGGTPAPTPPPPAPPPANDNIGNAKTIDHQGGSLVDQDRIDISGATNESTDPFFPFTTPKKGFHTVWYKVTPVSTGTLAVNTLGSAYDTILGVFTRDAAGALKRVKWNDNTSTRTQSSLSITTGIGVTYYIEVASKTTKGGLLAFNLKYTPAIPANNRIAYARVFKDTGLGRTTTLSLVEDVARANVTTDEPLLQGDPRGRGYHTVWFKFTPLQNGTLTATTSGSNYNTIIGAWRYYGGKWTWIGMNDDWDGQQAGFQLNATTGTRYLIGVMSNDLTGPSKLKFNFNFQP